MRGLLLMYLLEVWRGMDMLEKSLSTNVVDGKMY